MIFAEEDYRTYPERHAAFVNLAREIFIENELCLLGFSGDDPNFMQWAGWVRDRLGDSARRIYLVGNLELPPARRRYFEAHNIAPIDLAPLVHGAPAVERHTEATRLFIEALRRARPTPEHEWSITAADAYPLHKAGPTAFEQARKSDAFAVDLLVNTIAIFAKDRAAYPDWLVCPRKYRMTLVQGATWLLRKPVLNQLQTARRVEVLWELVWRHTIAFAPLDMPLEQAIAELLETPDIIIEPDRRCAFAVALMRYARFCDDGATLERWGKMVENAAPPRSPYLTEARYQKCLYARDRLDVVALSKAVTTLNSDDPIWQLRRAALLAEIGEHTVATKLIKDVTNSLERQYRLARTSLSVKSRLGWADWLSRGADLLTFPKSVDAPRPRDFKNVHVDPYGEIAAVDDGATEAWLRESEEDRGVIPLFDPGHYRDSTKSIRLGGGDRALLLRYELDQLIEFVGLPIRINHVNLCANAALGTARITYEASPGWYARLLRALHSHFDKSFDRYFGRIAIAQLSADASASLIRTVRSALSYWWRRVKMPYAQEQLPDLSYAVDQARLHLMALSRLTVRMAPGEAKEVFLYARDLALDPAIGRPWLLEALAELARCAAAAIPPSGQGNVALACIEFPLASEKNYSHRAWQDPLQAIWNAMPSRSSDDSRWTSRILKLLEESEKGKPGRPEATFRLAYLHLRDILSADEREAFARTLWSETDGQEDELPAGTGLLPSVFAKLPVPPGIDMVQRLQKRIYDRDPLPPPSDPAILGIPASSDDEALLATILNSKFCGLALNAGRAVEMFDRLTDWRPISIESLDPLRASIAKSSGERLRNYVSDVLREIVVPAMMPSARTEARGRRLLEFIREVRAWRALPCLSYFLETDPSLREEVRVAIERGLVAYDHQQLYGASTAVVTWAKLTSSASALELPRSLIDKLIAGVELHHKRGIVYLLDAARQLFTDGFLEEEDTDSLVGALKDLRLATAYGSIRLESEESVHVSLVRAECVRLASALRSKETTDETLAGWLQDADTDPLPEVRFSLAAPTEIND